jgi:dienelactone hydrolase
MKTSLGWLAFLAASLVAAPAMAVSYEGAGPHKTTTVPISGPFNGQMAYPDGAGPFPLLILGHGFSAAPDNQIGWGEHFASWGFVAVAPELCTGALCAPDATKAPAIVNAAIAYATGGTAPAAIAGKVDVSRLGLEGHSAGGQAMAYTAAMLKPGAIVLFDPVPGGMAATDLEPGKTAVGQICSPLLTMFADPSSCNKNEAWRPFALTSTGPRLGMVVTGSTHCDGENHPRALCGPVCGGAADTKRQGRYGHYATAWFLAYLTGDAAAKGELDFAKIKADSGVHDPAGVDDPSCVNPVGAGGAGGAGGASAGTGGMTSAGGSGAGATGGTTSAAGTGGGVSAAGGASVDGAGGATAGTGGTPSGSSGQSAAATPASDSSGGCGCRTAGRAPMTLAPLGLAIAALGARRRRRPALPKIGK